MPNVLLKMRQYIMYIQVLHLTKNNSIRPSTLFPHTAPTNPIVPKMSKKTPTTTRTIG